MHYALSSMLTFAHPALLWLAPLALVPVILHLLSRISPRSLRFPATRFLRNSPMPLQGRRHWQDILLMIIRTALLTILVLLMARPSWTNPPEETHHEQEGIAAILDTSPSICACIEGLRAEASALSKDTYFISGLGQALTPDSWTLGNALPNMSNTMLEASKYLSRFPAGGRSLHIFSDFQSSNWSDELPPMPEGTEIILHTNPSKVTSNWALTEVRCEQVGDSQLRILATCRNWSEEAATRELSLELDGKTTRQELSLAPNSSAAAAFLVPLPQDSRGRISVTPGDDFPFDDSRLFWARPEPPHPILTIFSGEDEKLSKELEFFVVPALTSEPNDAPQRYTTIPLDITGLPYAELSEQAAIFLLGAADRLDDEGAEKLRSYVQDGGVLFHVPGASPLVGWRTLQKAGLAPRGTATHEKRPTGIGAIKAGDSLLGLFPDKAPSDLHLFHIENHLKVPSSDASDTTMLSTMEGTPALIHRAIGKGQVFLFTFGFDSKSSDFPLAKSFLPLLRELLGKALGNRSEILSVFCGNPPPIVKNLDGSEVQNPPDTANPGLAIWGNHLLEITIPPQESIPTYRSTEEIARALKDRSASITQQNAGNSRPLSAQCAWLLVALALIEAMLAGSAKDKEA